MKINSIKETIKKQKQDLDANLKYLMIFSVIFSGYSILEMILVLSGLSFMAVITPTVTLIMFALIVATSLICLVDYGLIIFYKFMNKKYEL